MTLKDKYINQIIEKILEGRIGMNIITPSDTEPQWYAFNGADVLSIRGLISEKPQICGILKLNCLEAFRQLDFIKGKPVKEHDQDRISMLKKAINYLLETDHKDTVLTNMQSWLEQVKAVN